MEINKNKPVRAFLVMYEDGSYDAVKEGVIIYPVRRSENDYDIDVNFLNLFPHESLQMLKYVQDGLIANIKNAKKAADMGVTNFSMDYEGGKE